MDIFYSLMKSQNSVKLHYNNLTIKQIKFFNFIDKLSLVKLLMVILIKNYSNSFYSFN